MIGLSTLRENGTIPPNYLDYVGYWGMHAVCLTAFFTGVTQGDLLLCLVSYVVRIFGISGVYHRYFAHRSYKTSRPMQFLLALLGTLAVQKGVLWWVDYHRRHHRMPDTPEDVHSPIHRSFWYSHSGWFIDNENREADLTKVPDLVKYPELVWLNDNNHIPVFFYALSLLIFFGPSGLVWGFFISTILIWHATHSVGSFGHSDNWGGRRRFPTPDYSRNNRVIAILTLGDGWHNNHHYYPGSARAGFVWWEYDPTYWVLKIMSWMGLIWDLRQPPEHARTGGKGRFRRDRRIFQRDLILFRRRIDDWIDDIRDSQSDLTPQRFKEYGQLRQALCDRIDEFDDETLELLRGGPVSFKKGFEDLKQNLIALARESLQDRLGEDQLGDFEECFRLEFGSLFPKDQEPGDEGRIVGNATALEGR